MRSFNKNGGARWSFMKPLWSFATSHRHYQLKNPLFVKVVTSSTSVRMACRRLFPSGSPPIQTVAVIPDPRGEWYQRCFDGKHHPESVCASSHLFQLREARTESDQRGCYL